MPRTIMIPVDGSPASIKCVEWADKQILTGDDEVVLVRVVNEIKPGHHLSEEIHATIKKQNEFTDAEAKGGLETLAQTLKGRKVDIQVLHGDARDEIKKYAEALKPDMVVIGSRGLSGIKKFMLGSTAEYLVHHLSLPVMVLH